MVRDPPDRARRRKPGRARPCGGPGPSPSHGPIRRPPAAAGAATYGGSAPRAALATEGARLERAPASLAGARRTGSVTRPGRLSGPGLRGPGRLGASGVEVPDWQRRGWRAASGGGRRGGRAPGSDRGSAPAEIEPFRDHRAGRTLVSRGWALSPFEKRRCAFNGATRRELPREADAADLPVWSYNVAPHPKRNACSFALLGESSLLVCCEGMEEKFSGIARICLAVCTPHTFKVTMF
jgi:hypothetical protein